MNQRKFGKATIEFERARKDTSASKRTMQKFKQYSKTNKENQRKWKAAKHNQEDIL